MHKKKKKWETKSLYVSFCLFLLTLLPCFIKIQDCHFPDDPAASTVALWQFYVYICLMDSHSGLAQILWIDQMLFSAGNGDAEYVQKPIIAMLGCLGFS